MFVPIWIIILLVFFVPGLLENMLAWLGVFAAGCVIIAIPILIIAAIISVFALCFHYPAFWILLAVGAFDEINKKYQFLTIPREDKSSD